jgi:hypothetical protein
LLVEAISMTTAGVSGRRTGAGPRWSQRRARGMLRCVGIADGERLHVEDVEQWRSWLPSTPTGGRRLAGLVEAGDGRPA